MPAIFWLSACIGYCLWAAKGRRGTFLQGFLHGFFLGLLCFGILPPVMETPFFCGMAAVCGAEKPEVFFSCLYLCFLESLRHHGSGSGAGKQAFPFFGRFWAGQGFMQLAVVYCLMAAHGKSCVLRLAAAWAFCFPR